MAGLATRRPWTNCFGKTSLLGSKSCPTLGPSTQEVLQIGLCWAKPAPFRLLSMRRVVDIWVVLGHVVGRGLLLGDGALDFIWLWVKTNGIPFRDFDPWPFLFNLRSMARGLFCQSCYHCMRDAKS